MVTVTSAELQRHFGAVREQALREPVTITHHGRTSLVVLSADEFNRLKALDTRRHYYVWELPDELAAALEHVTPPAESMQFAHEEP